MAAPKSDLNDKHIQMINNNKPTEIFAILKEIKNNEVSNILKLFHQHTITDSPLEKNQSTETTNRDGGELRCLIKLLKINKWKIYHQFFQGSTLPTTSPVGSSLERKY